MSEYTLRILGDGAPYTLPASSDGSLLDALRAGGCTAVHTPCGGKGICRRCTVTVSGPIDAGDGVRTAEQEAVLACRVRPAGDCTLVIPENRAMDIVTDGAEDLPAGGEGLGVAVDIGTTTVAVFLYDLATGRRLGVDSGRSAQRPYGADVISRIQYCEQADGLAALQRAILGQLQTSIARLCSQAGRATSEVRRVTIAGNTVMEHIADGLSPVTIGRAPFTTLSLFGDCRAAAHLLPALADDAQIYFCPALAGYVGGDITAGLLASGASGSDALCLFLDIGTNGEMGLGDRSGFLCCATAAGPAFEGAEIACGMDASPGAINRVRLTDGAVRYETIGNVPAAGLCGSGLVDAVAALLRAGVIDETGRLLSPDEVDAQHAPHLRRGEDAQWRWYFTEEVYLSAADIRQLQLAKSAIRAGVETLLKLRGKDCRDVERVLIAGGFGAYMDVESACAIGLLPPALLGKTQHVGNSAGAGAALALRDEAREALRALADRCEYHELSASAVFMDAYIEAMMMDEWEDVYGND